MLASSKLTGFVVTLDYDRARAFYVDALGAEFISRDQYALVVRMGGNRIRIVKIPGFTPARNTVLGWEVADIEAAVRWLRERGVALEDYPFIQDREQLIWSTPDGSKVAWFRDPDGNVLSVSHHPAR